QPSAPTRLKLRPRFAAITAAFRIRSTGEVVVEGGERRVASKYVSNVVAVSDGSVGEEKEK
ncbi:unnamed protein product, partial [Dovyalis caffra]